MDLIAISTYLLIGKIINEVIKNKILHNGCLILTPTQRYRLVRA